MHSITNIIWGISDITVEHPETCKITYNLETQFHAHHQLKEALVPSIYLSAIQGKVVSMQAPLHMDLSQCEETNMKKSTIRSR